MTAIKPRTWMILATIGAALACGQGHYENFDGEEIIPENSIQTGRSNSDSKAKDTDPDEEPSDEADPTNEGPTDLGLVEFKKQMPGINTACISCHYQKSESDKGSGVASIVLNKDQFAEQRDEFLKYKPSCNTQEMYDNMVAPDHAGSGVAKSAITKAKLDAWVKVEAKCQK